MAPPGAVIAPSRPSSADEQYAHLYAIVTAFRAASPSPSGQIAVAAFLSAMTNFLRVFDALAAIGDLVKKDISGNIRKLGRASSRHGTHTLASLLAAEMSDAKFAKDIRAERGDGASSGAVALLWMKRTVQFVDGLLRRLLASPTASLADAARASYAVNLSLCHNFVTRGVFDTGLRFAPARDVFYANLGCRGDEAKARAGLQEMVDAVRPVLESVEEVLARHELETYIK